jgi:hypothetical protein
MRRRAGVTTTTTTTKAVAAVAGLNLQAIFTVNWPWESLFVARLMGVLEFTVT